jgi:hypothetical protein
VDCERRATARRGKEHAFRRRDGVAGHMQDKTNLSVIEMVWM